MKTNNVTKLILAALAVAGISFIGLTQIHANFLPLLGVVISYMAALAILGLAALDSGSAKRLS